MHDILVADDDARVREWLKEVLARAGHDVISVEDGQQALAAARHRKFDVIVTDIYMPNQEGLGLIRALRKQQPGTKIVAISGRGADTLEDATLLGAHAALSKPISGSSILGLIARL